MTALLHALANLARLRWLGVAFCVLAMLCSTTQASALTRPTASDRVNAVAVTAATASANEREQAKTRVGGFEQNSSLNVCANAFASAETHRGISNAQCETASAFSHAAEGAIPETLARVIPANIEPTMLGVGEDVFVTDAAALRGLNASQIAEGLGIPESASGFRVYEFSSQGLDIASPINRLNPGFAGQGLTSGGLPEYVIPNASISPTMSVWFSY